MTFDCDMSSKTKTRLLAFAAVFVVVTIAVAVPLALRGGKDDRASKNIEEADSIPATSSPVPATNHPSSQPTSLQCLFGELGKLPLPTAMQGNYPLKPNDLPAISRIQVAPNIDTFVVKLNLDGNQDLVLMIKNLAGQWDEVVLDDALPDAVYGWDLSAEGDRLAYRHVPDSCPNNESFCNGYKVVQINKGVSGSGLVTTVSEVLNTQEVYDAVDINHDGTIGVSVWKGPISSATGFPQVAVMMHNLDTGGQIGNTRLVLESVLDVVIEEGQRVSYYAHNPFTNENRLDVIELDGDGKWVDLVNPHPTFVSIRFASPALLNNGETVAYCKVDNDFNGEFEFQELKDGLWSISSDKTHGDLQDHLCRDMKVSQDHTKILLQFKDGSDGEGDNYMGMFWLEDGVWIKKDVKKIPDEVLVSSFARGFSLDNKLLAMDSSASQMMVLMDGPHPDHVNSEQHFAHYGFGCNPIF